MLFKLSDLNWIEISSECKLGKITQINRVTLTDEIGPEDDMHMNSRRVTIKTKNPSRFCSQKNGGINSYTFNLIGLCNAKINNEKVLDAENEFYLLGILPEAEEINKNFIDMMMLNFGEEYYRLALDYIALASLKSETEIQDYQRQIHKIKNRKTMVSSEKEHAINILKENIDIVLASQLALNRIETHVEAFAQNLFNTYTKPKKFGFIPEREDYLC